MKTHFMYQATDGNRPAVTDHQSVMTWCGRELRPSQTTKTLTQVSCERCQQAFSARLRQLPDAPKGQS